MALWHRRPVFCFTSDVDWASEAVIAYSHSCVGGDDLKLTYFSTHPSLFLDRCRESGRARILIHPNFLPGSSHGDTYDEVIEYCQTLVSDADGFRTHRYFESNDILDEFARRGFKFFSNHCTRCETHLRPLCHRSGMTSIPIFLEDGGYLLMDPTLQFDALRERLEAPGLKLINFHPTHMAFNTPSFAYTREIKDRYSREEWNSLSSTQIRDLEHKEDGVRTTIQRIIDHIHRRKHSVLSIHEVYEQSRLEMRPAD